MSNLGYQRLGVSEQDVSRSFAITPQLRQIAKQIKLVQGQTTSPLSELPTNPYYYLHCSGEEDAKKILSSYYSITKSLRRSMPIEAFCLAAGVPPLRCLELIVSACVRAGAAASTMLAAASHPRVVEKTIEVALTADGHADRQDLHKAVGFLPTPKGPSVKVNVTQTATAQAAAVAPPPPEQTIRRLVDRFNDKSLPDAQPAELTEGQPNNLPMAMPMPTYLARDPVPAPVEISDDDFEDEG